MLAMVLDALAAPDDLAAKPGMLCHTLTDAKEGRLGLIAVEDVQNLRGDLRVGAVVDGDGYFAVPYSGGG